MTGKGTKMFQGAIRNRIYRAVAPLTLGLFLAFFVAATAWGGGTLTRVSTDAAGGQANGYSASSSTSVDGRYVAFMSFASNLVPGDGNGYSDIFVKDTLTGSVVRASTSASGVEGSCSSEAPSISGDGRHVAFQSCATNLVPGDSNGSFYDIFVKDLQTGNIVRASSASDGAQANDYSFYPYISADGRRVAFHSKAGNLVAGDTNGTWDVFVKDLQTGVTMRASTDLVNGQGNNQSLIPSLSADGRYVAFQSNATNLVPGDSNNAIDVFVKDTLTGNIVRASSGLGATEVTGVSMLASISGDGRYVAFYSESRNLVAGDTNNFWDVFVKDLQTGTVLRANTDTSGVQANDHIENSYRPSISANGRYIAFVSLATNLVANDYNGVYDVFVKDTAMGSIIMASANASGIEADDRSNMPSLSAGGRFVSFSSYARSLVNNDTNNRSDIFLKENSFPRDNQAPQVTYQGPAGTVYADHTTVTATYSDPAPSSGIDTSTAYVTLNGGSPISCSASDGNIQCEVAGLQKGSYQARVFISDNDGNTGSAQGQFQVCYSGLNLPPYLEQLRCSM